MRVKRFYEPIFGVDVTFVTESTPEKIKEFVKRRFKRQAEGYDTTSGSVSVIVNEDKNGVKSTEYLIVVEEKKDFYTLLHECVHLTRHILEDHMVPLTPGNDEIFAYYQTWWFKQMWRFMNKKVVKLIRKKHGKNYC